MQQQKLLKIPFGSELSPDVIDLSFLLNACHQFRGNKVGLENCIKEQYFANAGNGNEKNRKTLAMNCRLSLQNYLLLTTDTFELTPIGEKLYGLIITPEAMYKEFAKHILLNLNGIAFLQCIREMHAASERIDLTTLRQACLSRGLSYPSGGKHPSIMRLWLAKVEVFVGRTWNINEERVEAILGTKDNADALSELNLIQKAFLKALINTGIKDFQPTTRIVKLAEAVFGVRFPEKSLPKLVLDKLVGCGFIEAVKTTNGRGAKPFNVRLKPGIDPTVLFLTLKQLENAIEPKLHQLMMKPLAEIMQEIKSDDRYVSGLALEALAFKLMRIIDMDYVATRLRGESTGGAEVDLIFESARLVYSRWQIQCKNTANVSLDPVAKEVGLTHFLKSNVVVVVSTGYFSSEAERYSNTIMQQSNLSIVLIDKDDIQKISDDPTNIVDVFNREARRAMELKRIEL